MRKQWTFGIVIGLVMGVVATGTTVAVATASGGSVKVCATKGGVVRGAKANGKCPAKSKKRSVSVRGARGPRGFRGARGPQGPGSKDVRGQLTSSSTKTVVSYAGLTLTGSCGTYARLNVSGASYHVLGSGAYEGGSAVATASTVLSSGGNLVQVNKAFDFHFDLSAWATGRAYEVSGFINRVSATECNYVVTITP